MITEETKNLFGEVLSIENSEDRNFKFIIELIKLSSEEELEETRQFLQSLPEEQRARVRNYDEDINFEIQLRKDWISHFKSLDSILTCYPSVAKKIKGSGYKVALLRFCELCSCDVDLVCRLLEGIIIEFESGVLFVKRHCDDVNFTIMFKEVSRNNESLALRAMGGDFGRPCPILRNLFFPELACIINDHLVVTFVRNS